jgi:hypothetical protein
MLGNGLGEQRSERIESEPPESVVVASYAQCK